VISGQKSAVSRRKKFMNRKILYLALCALFLAPCVSAQAQQPTKVYRIGYLSALDPATETTRAETIRRALRELGYMEGQNIATEYRYTLGKVDRASELVAELAARGETRATF
jgi:hypothetical protein